MKPILPALLCSALLACGSSVASAESAHHPAAILGQQTTPLADVAAIDRALAGDRVVLKFGATWCPPCRAIAPQLDALAKARSDIVVVDIDTDAHGALAKRFQVQSIPALFLLAKGQVVDQKVGYSDQAALAAWVDAKLPR